MFHIVFNADENYIKYLSVLLVNIIQNIFSDYNFTTQFTCQASSSFRVVKPENTVLSHREYIEAPVYNSYCSCHKR